MVKPRVTLPFSNSVQTPDDRILTEGVPNCNSYDLVEVPSWAYCGFQSLKSIVVQLVATGCTPLGDVDDITDPDLRSCYGAESVSPPERHRDTEIGP